MIDLITTVTGLLGFPVSSCISFSSCMPLGICSFPLNFKIYWHKIVYINSSDLFTMGRICGDDPLFFP